MGYCVGSVKCTSGLLYALTQESIMSAVLTNKKIYSQEQLASYCSRWSLCSLRKQIILKETTAQHKQAHKGYVLINSTLYSGSGTRKKGLGRQMGRQIERKHGNNSSTFQY